MSAAARPIYGGATPSCPTPPPGNVHLLEYVTRLRGIMLQLASTKEKTIALERIAILKAEVETEISNQSG